MALLPPVLLTAVFGFVALVARDAIADPSDSVLQAATGRAYRRLAAAGWRSPWTVLGADPDVERLADLVVVPPAESAPDPAP